MSKEKEIQDAFKNLGRRRVETFTADVVEVDKANGTCKISDGELEYPDVQLASIINQGDQRFYLFPKVGSSVIVSPINEDLNRLYVEAYSEVEELNVKIGESLLKITAEGILLNGDAFGGIVKAPELKTQLEKMTARIDGIINALNNATPAAGSSDGGTAMKASISAALSAIAQVEDFSSIENEKVKHA